MEDKSNELADKVGVAIVTLLEEDFEGIKNGDCVTGILWGATAAIACVLRSKNVDDYEIKTAEALTLWAALYKEDKVVKPDPEK